MPTPTIMRNLTRTQKMPNVGPIIDITDKLPKHPSKQWSRRDPSMVQRIVVHHMASEAPLENQAKYHVNHHQWPGIAYHLCIVKGQIYQTNDLMSLTTHALGANPSGVGIAVLGDLSKRNMTDDERHALYAAILTVKELFPDAKIQGHNEASWETAQHATSCPCTDMDRIRKDIADIESQTALNQALEESVNANTARIFAAYTRFSDLYKLATKPGQYQQEAQRKILQIADMMVQAGILKQ